MGSCKSMHIVLLLLISSFPFYLEIVDGSIIKSMALNWGTQHSSIQGDSLHLVLDPVSENILLKKLDSYKYIRWGILNLTLYARSTFQGSGAQSKKSFLFGSIEMMIKLVAGNSAGTVTAYYLSSTGEKHDEIDFEFLGNISGQPYIVHTNVFTQGIGSREQQFHLWFDPTADFHNYTIHWNPNMIVWYVDGIPLRVYRNYQSKGIGYPNQQGMKVYTSLWNADNWATRGGLVKIDWINSPFIAEIRNFRPRACIWNGLASIRQCAMASTKNWWNTATYSKLSYVKQGQMMNWVRKNFMIYDYCKDTRRYNGNMPPECLLPQF